MRGTQKMPDMKKFVFFFIFLFLIFFTSQAHAASPYVLPYPGVMPGNKLYLISDLYDNAKSIYIFGDIASFKYNLSQSDKYLVEAKTLFEYNQYPLAAKSLSRSNNYFIKSYENITNARKHNKNIDALLNQHKQASLEHIEIVSSLKAILPESFIWEAEKTIPESIKIHELLEKTSEIRQKYE